MKDTNNISCWIFLCTMDAPKILMSSKILIKKWRDSFLCISARDCWYRNTLCVFILPSPLPAFLLLFLYTLLLVDFYCLLPSRRDINHFGAEVIFRKMLILSWKCFSYWKNDWFNQKYESFFYLSMESKNLTALMLSLQNRSRNTYASAKDIPSVLLFYCWSSLNGTA